MLKRTLIGDVEKDIDSLGGTLVMLKRTLVV